MKWNNLTELRKSSPAISFIQSVYIQISRPSEIFLFVNVRFPLLIYISALENVLKVSHETPRAFSKVH